MTAAQRKASLSRCVFDDFCNLASASHLCACVCGSVTVCVKHIEPESGLEKLYSSIITHITYSCQSLLILATFLNTFIMDGSYVARI